MVGRAAPRRKGLGNGAIPSVFVIARPARAHLYQVLRPLHFGILQFHGQSPSPIIRRACRREESPPRPRHSKRRSRKTAGWFGQHEAGAFGNRWSRLATSRTYRRGDTSEQPAELRGEVAGYEGSRRDDADQERYNTCAGDDSEAFESMLSCVSGPIDADQSISIMSQRVSAPGGRWSLPPRELSEITAPYGNGVEQVYDTEQQVARGSAPGRGTVSYVNRDICRDCRRLRA